MVKKSNLSSDIFAYNLKNLKDTCKLRGANRKRVLGEMEFMRTHEFKVSKNPKKDAKALGWDVTNFKPAKNWGQWVKRKKQIKKINFKCERTV